MILNTKALHTLSYGVYIVSARSGEKVNGQVANAAIQISNDPPSLAVSINKENLTHALISEGGHFCVSVLSQDAPLPLIAGFGFRSGREVDKFAEVPHAKTQAHLPYPKEHTLAYLDCKVTATADAKTHTIFIGDVVEAEVLSDTAPMTYAYYHQVKKGTTPKNAPTYQGKQEKPEKEGTNEMAESKNYVCDICGYVYEPAAGDPDNGVEPGTSFADVPDSWVCPVCGASKDDFSPEG